MVTHHSNCCDQKSRTACAQSFALRQQAAIEITRRDHSIIACPRHIYIVFFFRHIPFVVNHTINATPTERLQQHPLLFTTNRTDRTFFCVKAEPSTTFTSWSQHHFVDVSICKHVSSIGESDSLCTMKWRRRYTRSRLLETWSRQGIWEVTLYTLFPSTL